MLTYVFNFEKTLQAAVEVLQKHHGQMEPIRLLKILYIADRELLAEMGRPLTGDQAIAMKRGPVLSRVYGLIKDTGSRTELDAWNAAMRRDGHELTLQGKAGVDRLTKAELRKLAELCERYWDKDSDELSALTHDFKEWANVFDESKPESSFPIEWEAALEAQGKADRIEEVRFVNKERELAEAAFRE